MKVTRRRDGRPVEVSAIDADEVESEYRLAGVTLQRRFKPATPWYDVPAEHWRKMSADELRATACLLDGREEGLT